MRGRFFGGLRDERYSEFVRNHGGDVPDRDSFLGDGVVTGVRLPALERQTERLRGVADVNGRPALRAVADVGRDPFRTRDRDQRRHEVSILVAMDDSEA